MNISAIKSVDCSPIKPRVSFGFADTNDEYNKVLGAATRINDTFINNSNEHTVESNNIKKPLAAFASIVLAGVVAFVSGKKVADIICHVFKKAPEVFDNALKSGSQKMTDLADHLKNVADDKRILKKVPVGKLSHGIGGAFEKVQSGLKTVYSKIAKIGLPENADAAVKAKTAMQNLVGVTFVASAVPGILGKDTNKDGVSDILQRGQNAYTGTQTKFGDVVQKANSFADIVLDLT